MLLEPVIGPERVSHLVAVGQQVAEELSGRRVVSINSTATGGGVAEMLPVLLSYAAGAGIDCRWFVFEGTTEFFAVTKRLHHRLHGERGDGGPLGQAERDVMANAWQHNMDSARELIHDEDAVLLHDPQPAPMAKWLHDRGIPVIWRCHIGVDVSNEYAQEAWAFLEPLLEPYVDQYVFTRRKYAPDWVPNDKLHVIRPALDPFAPKNRELTSDEALRILQHVGVVAGEPDGAPTYPHSDGKRGEITDVATVVCERRPAASVPIVTQVSRWDPLKDMGGVMDAFVASSECADAHLVLAGPDVSGVSDDPEGQQVLDEVIEAWRALDPADRCRVSVVCFPMHDTEQNAIMVNALQRHAAVVVQKSLKEGFGLTVTEAMFKGRPVVASAVGGIVDQIRDGKDGLLVPPDDLVAAGKAIGDLLAKPDRATEMGRQAHAATVDQFMPDSSLLSWSRALDAAVLIELR